jgi:hypothetical protein
MQKHEQIQRARGAFAGLMDAITGMDEQALTAPGIGEWSVREVLAHITGWTLLDAAIMHRLARGERPLPEGTDYGSTIDARNAGFAAEGASKSAAKVIGELHAAFGAFIAATEAVPEERFAEGRTAYRMMQGPAYEHLKEHRSELAAYRSTVVKT